MKKFFSLIALAGVLVACEPEKIETAFEVSNAQAVINVKTVEVSTGKDVTCTLTATAGTVSGNTITLVGNPAISATKVTVTAKYQGKDYTGSVDVSELIAGAKAAYGLQILVGEIPSEYSFELVKGEATTVTHTEYAKIDGHDASHSHDSQDWFYNMSNFFLNVKINIKANMGIVVPEKSVTYSTEATSLKEVVDLYANAMNSGLKPFEGTVEGVVSAWAMYNVQVDRKEASVPYTVKATKDGKTTEIGKFHTRELMEAVGKINEKAIPGHSHDYVHGHGHDSHGTNNAGGGIVIAD